MGICRWVWQVFLANVVQASVILSAAKDLGATAGDEILRCAQNDSTRRLAKNFCHTPADENPCRPTGLKR